MGVLADVQRFDAQPVAAEQHAAAVALGYGEREHPVQPIDELLTPPVVVRLEQHLGVAVREEPVTVPGELVAQGFVVVDAAVPGDRQPEVGVHHRLRTGLRQVDDLQPTMTECHPALRPHARSVRPAGGLHRLRHSRHRGHVGGA